MRNPNQSVDKLTQIIYGFQGYNNFPEMFALLQSSVSLLNLIHWEYFVDNRMDVIDFYGSIQSSKTFGAAYSQALYTDKGHVYFMIRARYSELPLQNIALELGFTDSSHLNKMMKKHFGQGMREIRKKQN